MSEVATLPDLGVPWFDNQASCAELTIEAINDLFFDNNMHGQEAKDAKRICAACPAVEECEAYIIRVEHGVGYSSMRGIWAGMTPAERYRKYHKAEKTETLMNERLYLCSGSLPIERRDMRVDDLKDEAKERFRGKAYREGWIIRSLDAIYQPEKSLIHVEALLVAPTPPSFTTFEF